MKTYEMVKTCTLAKSFSYPLVVEHGRATRRRRAMG
jgi:hypothetical protein